MLLSMLLGIQHGLVKHKEHDKVKLMNGKRDGQQRRLIVSIEVMSLGDDFGKFMAVFKLFEDVKVCRI